MTKKAEPKKKPAKAAPKPKLFEIKDISGEVIYTGGDDLYTSVKEAVEYSADLSSANLYSANLSSANLSSAKYSDYVFSGPIMQLGNVAEWGWMLWYAEEKGDLRVICGCRHFSLAEAKEHWKGRPDRPMTRVAISMADIWYESVKAK